MRIHSTCLGELDVPEECILSFPHGISGFENEREFALIEHQDGSPFTFFQSIASPNVIFITIDPFDYFNNYQIEIDDETEHELQFAAEDLPWVACMVNIPENPAKMTANLVAPIVVNQKQRLAKQVVLDRSNYRTKHRVFSDPAQKSAGEF